MKTMAKLVVVLSCAVMPTMILAGEYKLCHAKIMGSRDGFCSACKYKPVAKQMQKEEKARELAEKQRIEMQKTPLNLKSFLGFEFLSKAEGKERSKSVKLAKPFRAFAEAQLEYTPQNRLYCISIAKTFEKFSCDDVATEVNTIVRILEKKYDSKFPGGVSCDNGVQTNRAQTANGNYAMDRKVYVPEQVIDLKRTRYFAEQKWADVTIEVEGVFYRPPNGYPGRQPYVCVSVSMPEILKEDKEARKKDSDVDEEGIDVL